MKTLVLALAIAAVACQKNAGDRAAATVTYGASISEPAPFSGEATERIARARCDREIACGRIGDGENVTTSAQCMAGVREAARADVDAAECSAGFDGSALGLCLTAIRQLPCDVRLDGIASLGACERSNLCI